MGVFCEGFEGFSFSLGFKGCLVSCLVVKGVEKVLRP